MRVLSRISLVAVALATIVGFASVSLSRADEAPAAATGTISGKVVDKDGKAVAGATVQAVKPREAGEAHKKQQAGGHQGPEKIGKSATSAADGTYKLTDIPAGKVNVTARLQGEGFGHIGPIEVTAGQDTKADDIKLEKKMGGGKTP